MNGEQGESNGSQANQTKVGQDTNIQDGSAMTQSSRLAQNTSARPVGGVEAHIHQNKPVIQVARKREDALKQTPSTPAVEFYASTSKKHPDQAKDALHCPDRGNEPRSQEHFQQPVMQPLQQPVAATLPSTSLEGIVSSTPILHMHQQFQSQGGTQGPYQVTGISPISPALMCTNEVLMLPGQTSQHPTAAHSMPVQNPNLSAQSMPSNAQNMTTQQQQWTPTANKSHVNPQMTLPAWLQHMNNVASMAGQLSSQTQQAASQTSVLSNPTAPYNTGQHQPIFPQQQMQVQNSPGHQVFPGNASNDLMPFPMSHLRHLNGYKEPNATETKEKRERRLARNRESARQSRRRKKELLLNLQAQVNKLHNDIENERRRKLNSMESALIADKEQILNDIFRDKSFNGHTALNTEKLVFAVRNGGPNTIERKTAVNFQYTSLQNLFLPRNRRMLLSLSLQNEKFFASAKEARIKVRKVIYFS